MKLLKTFVCMTLISCASGCVQLSYVKVDGQISKGINFCFYNNPTDKLPSERTLDEMLVQLHKNASAPSWDVSSWKTVWEIEGPFAVRCMMYGAESDTFQTIIKALPLTANAEYRVLATDTRGFAPRYPSLIFRINADGVVEKTH